MGKVHRVILTQPTSMLQLKRKRRICFCPPNWALSKQEQTLLSFVLWILVYFYMNILFTHWEKVEHLLLLPIKKKLFIFFTTSLLFSQDSYTLSHSVILKLEPTLWHLEGILCSILPISLHLRSCLIVILQNLFSVFRPP